MHKQPIKAQKQPTKKQPKQVKKIQQQKRVLKTTKRTNTTTTTTTSNAKPFRILGVQQIAVGQVDKGLLMPFWHDALGLTKIGNFKSEKENVDEDILQMGTGPLAVEIDIMQPIDKNKSPKVHEPVLNHVGLWVDDLPACVDSLTKQGVRFTPGGIRKGASGFDVTFVHPKGNEQFPIGSGALVELVQAPPQVIAAFDSMKNVNAV